MRPTAPSSTSANTVNTVMAGIVVLTVFALLLDDAVGRIEKRLMKWQPRSGETEKL
jgi:NitT/TauT family transport system permease protein